MQRHVSFSGVATGARAVASLLIAFTTVHAADIATQLTAAEDNYRAGDQDAALKELEPLLTATGGDEQTQKRIRDLAARILHARGEEHFRKAHIKESIADFEREVKLRPDRAPEHWQLGIAYYDAGEYQKGAKQFALHKTVNPQDVENAAWHFLCVARAPGGSVDAARKSLIDVARDERVPMAQIQKMFAGKLEPEEVLTAGNDAGGAAKFYADLYVGLYYEALGKTNDAFPYLKLAAENPTAKNSYMGDVARVHVSLLRSRKQE